jgi:hypothetical protein
MPGAMMPCPGFTEFAEFAPYAGSVTAVEDGVQ